MKPAGGISAAKGALQYLVMPHETSWNARPDNQMVSVLGPVHWANDLLLLNRKETRGVYFSKDYICWINNFKKIFLPTQPSQFFLLIVLFL